MPKVAAKGTIRALQCEKGDSFTLAMRSISSPHHPASHRSVSCLAVLNTALPSLPKGGTRPDPISEESPGPERGAGPSPNPLPQLQLKARPLTPAAAITQAAT